jgi:serine/threonine protein kinase
MNTNALREEEVFDAARRISDPTERRGFLASACGEDRALRSRLEALLQVAEQAEDFFAESKAAVSSTIAALHLSRGTMGVVDAAGAYLPGEEPIGTRIGRYKLLQKIGEGGCGIVYEAEQQEPVRRRVALKIIKLGMETKSVIARFEAERQALAMMDHPNIAHVFDAGATRRGPPYFVMELVRGVKVTDYCDQNHFDTRERLLLFIQICHAIQHAHQKGIVHGDIKPSNLMVTPHDGVAVPKVIDFGISKAMESQLNDKLLVTANGQPIGTPAYMSPEQAEMGGLDIDTRSDIYSLGVLLYELLTGRTPFDPKALVAEGVDVMRRTLRETEPIRPSVRLKTMGAVDSEALTARHADPAKLSARFRGDLDWIVMKTLEKDRRRRYETANGLAMDIQRFLDNEPVMARPPSRFYRFQKLVRRNRGVFIAGGVVAAVLVAGMSTSTWLFLREREARRRAEFAEQQETRLRFEAEVRQKITQAALLVSQDRFEQADALLTDVSVTQPTLEGAAVFRAVGEWHVVENRWKQAADRFAVLCRIDQLDGRDVSTLDSLRQGPVLIEGADLSGYERFRDEVIARYATTTAEVGDRIVKISLLRPATEPVLQALRPYADATAKAFANAESSGDVFMAAWRSVSLALWEYRSGNYLKAVQWAQRCLDYPETNAPRTATARIILALAFQQLGRGKEAQLALNESRDLFGSKAKTHLERGTPVQGFWFDWLFARILLHEAKALIETPTL